ncbi:hypothetical protein MKK53_04390, partial [Methylobacterium sp. J-076]|nr:hypothetical protein [Methylobacterium sp. J-076]
VDRSVALGDYATTSAATNVSSVTIGGTTFGGFAGTSPVGVVSVGAPVSERQIQNVAAVRVTASSTDAVNGSQLYPLASNVGAMLAAWIQNSAVAAFLALGLRSIVGSQATAVCPAANGPG